MKFVDRNTWQTNTHNPIPPQRTYNPNNLIQTQRVYYNKGTIPITLVFTFTS